MQSNESYKYLIKTENLLFQSKINVIGADWKNFDQANNRWSLVDSTAYFIKTANGKIYKIIFTGFGGSANTIVGKYVPRYLLQSFHLVQTFASNHGGCMDNTGGRHDHIPHQFLFYP